MQLTLSNIISISLILLPIWWLVGIEQFIFPVIFFILILVKNSGKVKLQKNTIVLTLGLFIITYIISSLFIIETYRYITYLRNFSAYLAVWFLSILIFNYLHHKDDILKIIDSIIILLTLCSIIGLLGILGIFQSEFKSLLGLILKAGLEPENYLYRIVNRSIGDIQWFSSFGEYYRVTSLFMYSTAYSTALGVGLILCIYRFFTLHSLRNRILLFVIIITIISNLIFTTARVSILSVVISLVYIFIKSNFFKKIRGAYFLLFIFISTLSFLYIFKNNFNKEIEKFNSAIESAIFARGGSSPTQRLDVYLATIEGFTHRPFFGWGTERDISGLKYPAGSHSMYLGTLYKQGLIGLGILLLLYFRIFKNLSSATSVGLYGRAILLFIFINGFTDVLDLDAVTLILSWGSLFLLIALNNNQKKVNYESKHILH